MTTTPSATRIEADARHVTPYTVNGCLQEGQCDECGFPIYNDDTAFTTPAGGMFCCRRHALNHLDKLEQPS